MWLKKHIFWKIYFVQTFKCQNIKYYKMYFVFYLFAYMLKMYFPK